MTQEEWHYKGEGRVVFSAGNQFGGGEVVDVVYDPAETGYRR